MFGNRMLSKVTIKASEEGVKQHKIVVEELGKLAELTNQGWDLVSSELFDKARKISFGEGVICGTALTGVVVAAHEIVKKRKSKTDKEK